jgi:hypothetical protein
MSIARNFKDHNILVGRNLKDGFPPTLHLSQISLELELKPLCRANLNKTCGLQQSAGLCFGWSQRRISRLPSLGDPRIYQSLSASFPQLAWAWWFAHPQKSNAS